MNNAESRKTKGPSTTSAQTRAIAATKSSSTTTSPPPHHYHRHHHTSPPHPITPHTRHLTTRPLQALPLRLPRPISARHHATKFACSKLSLDVESDSEREKLTKEAVRDRAPRVQTRPVSRHRDAPTQRRQLLACFIIANNRGY